MKLKTLVISFILVLVLAFSAQAFVEDEMCTIKKGEKVVQLMPGNVLRGTIAPDDIEMHVGPTLVPAASANVNRIFKDFNWDTAHIGSFPYDFGRGPVLVVVVVRPESVKDCAPLEASPPESKGEKIRASME